jgi:hypothetical protein
MWKTAISAISWAGTARGTSGFAAGLLLGLAACASDDPASPPQTAPGSTPPRETTSGATLATPRFAYAVVPLLPSGAVSFTPPTMYSFNSAGGAISVTPLATGSYNVHFEGLSRPGMSLSNPNGVGSETVVTTAHYSVYAPPATCNVLTWMSWLSVSRLTARVDCFNSATGQPVDAPFSILVVGNGALPPRNAFALANQPTATLYTPDPKYSYTTGPGALGVSRVGVGSWDWRMGTGSPAGAIHLVNAATNTEVCRIAEYKSLGPNVRCSNTDGAPRDVVYQLLQVSRGRENKRFGFAWADQATRTTPYAPYAGYAYNSTGGPVQVQRLGVGEYTVSFAGLWTSDPTGHREVVQLSAFGAGFAACRTMGVYRQQSSTLVVQVHCTNHDGQLADSRFNVMVIE